MIFRTIEISNPKYESDGLRYLTVKSPALKGRADVSVFIPKAAKGKNGIPVIVLLHGVYGSHWGWTHKAGAHRTLQEMINKQGMTPFILAMPSDGLWGDGSGYVPHQFQNFEAWIGKELPELIRQTIDEVNANSNFYIAGLSMGGYGAFRIGIKYASEFKGISGHSSLTDIRDIQSIVEEDWTFWNTSNRDNSIVELILKNPEKAPPFRFDCGLEDTLLLKNRSLHQQLLNNNISHLYEEYAGGHDWGYWSKNVKRTFIFFQSLFVNH